MYLCNCVCEPLLNGHFSAEEIEARSKEHENEKTTPLNAKHENKTTTYEIHRDDGGGKKDKIGIVPRIIQRTARLKKQKKKKKKK